MIVYKNSLIQQVLLNFEQKLAIDNLRLANYKLLSQVTLTSCFQKLLASYSYKLLTSYQCVFDFSSILFASIDYESSVFKLKISIEFWIQSFESKKFWFKISKFHQSHHPFISIFLSPSLPSGFASLPHFLARRKRLYHTCIHLRQRSERSPYWSPFQAITVAIIVPITVPITVLQAFIRHSQPIFGFQLSESFKSSSTLETISVSRFSSAPQLKINISMKRILSAKVITKVNTGNHFGRLLLISRLAGHRQCRRCNIIAIAPKLFNLNGLFLSCSLWSSESGLFWSELFTKQCLVCLHNCRLGTVSVIS